LRKKDYLKLDERGYAINFIFVTCGDWDLRTMLPGQCKSFNLNRADYFNKWINIKKVYFNSRKVI
jgi:hypothetical protein